MRYRVRLDACASIYIDVEADSPEEAEAAAFEGEDCYISLCHQCAGNVDIGDPDVPVKWSNERAEISTYVTEADE
jgi:hypothetical protein